jgi:hypothetical protein
MEMIVLQDKFAARVADSMKSPWDEIQIHYENAEIEGLSREVFTALLFFKGAKQDIKLPLEALDLLIELQKHKPQGPMEAWTWLEFLLDKTGKYKFEFKYGNPPLIMEQVKYANR